MTVRCFVDTNVLLYFHDASEPEKQAAAARWLAAHWKARAGRVSYQVLLLTEDLSDGQRMDDLLVVNPFRTEPERVLSAG